MREHGSQEKNYAHFYNLHVVNQSTILQYTILNWLHLQKAAEVQVLSS